MEGIPHLDDRRINYDAVVVVIMVHQRGFNKVRHRVSEIVGGYVAYC